MVTLKLIESITEMEGGAISYRVPNKYFPNYRVNGISETKYDPNTYEFSYEVDVIEPKG